MKKVLILFILLQAFNTHANLESKVPPTIAGITIPNTHMLADNGSVYRGMAPKHRIQELINLGITDVLIFKNQTLREVDNEITALTEAGYRFENIHHIPFKWRDVKDLRVACQQTVQALQLIREVYLSQNRAIFFHCTVGEDRTGLLAGMWEILTTGKRTQTIFQKQMCERGYAAGNSHKPYFVVSAIRRNLTPLFFKMVRLVERGYLSFDNLDPASCGKMEWVKTIPRCN